MIEKFSGPIFIVCLMLFVVLYLITQYLFCGRPAFFEDFYDMMYHIIQQIHILHYNIVTCNIILYDEYDIVL